MLHPEDLTYWGRWFGAGVLALVLARLFLVNPIIRAIRQQKGS